jgi:hypothetical protein
LVEFEEAFIAQTARDAADIPTSLGMTGGWRKVEGLGEVELNPHPFQKKAERDAAPKVSLVSIVRLCDTM